MASLGQLVVNLEANIARFTSDMGRASQTVEQTMGRMNAAADVVKGVLGAVGVALSVDALVSEANRAIGALADLDDMAQKTGSSVEMLSRLGKVAAMTGVDFGTVDGALVKLSKNLADIDEKGSKTAKALAAIGISVEDIKGKDAAQAFVMISDKMQGYTDGAGKVANVTDLMGKTAANLLPYMNDVSENLDKFQGDSAEAAAKATMLQDGLGELRVKYDELKTGIVVGALPAAIAFIGALQDTMRESDKLSKDKSLTSWADHAGLVLARMADGGALVGRTFKAIGAELAATSANFDLMNAVMANSNPVGAAKVLLNGGSPTDNIKAALEKRNAIIAQANTMVSSLWTQPLDAMEQAYVKRLSENRNAAGLKALGNASGVGDISLGRTLDYTGTDEKKPEKEKKEKEGWTADGAADRMMRAALDETSAMQNTLDVTEGLIEADKRRAEQYARSAVQITANAENIRRSLMTDAEAEQLEHETRLMELEAYGALRLSNEADANALIEAETARHERAKLDIQRANQLQMLGMSGDAADQLYGLMQKAGMEQTALAKAVFLASKAIAVAEIIMNTEVAASKAQAQFGAWGTPIAMAIRVAGYASAGMTAGLAIASAEGGYDIPAGANPVTQLHEKEMVLPKAQAEVIRGLAARGGAAGGGVIINNSPVFNIDSRTDQQEVRKIVSMGVAQGNADLVDRLSRAGRI